MILYRKILIFLTIVLCQFAFSQDIIIKGIVKDVNSTESIEGVVISALHSNYSTMTNNDGFFELTVPKSTDSIRFSMLGYHDLNIAVDDSKQQEYFLQSKLNVLEEVIVIKGGVKSLINKLITTSKAKFSTPILLNSYFREFVNINDRYTKFSDGQLDYLLNRKSKKISSSLNVKQARAYRIPKDPEDSSDDLLSDLNGFDTDDLPAGISNFRFLEKKLLNGDEFDKYEFILKSRKISDDREEMTLYFNALEGIDEFLFKGSISFDNKSNLISNITLEKDQSKVEFAKEINILLFRFTILDQVIKANYRVVDNVYLLNNFSLNAKVKIKNKKRFNHIINLKSDMIVTNFSLDTSKFDSKKTYKGKSLFEFGTKFTTPFWKNNNAILLTPKEEAIVESLEKQTIR
jgi:hypothetical protein